jgi:hypothetical protein
MGKVRTRRQLSLEICLVTSKAALGIYNSLFWSFSV